MPRELTDEMLNQIKYVSMADYMRRVDRLTDLEDKLAFTTRYLLSYGTGEGRDHTLAEAIHIARMKIADASAKLRKDAVLVPDETVDPFIKPEEDAANRLFMASPTVYLRDEANRILRGYAGRELTEEDQRRIVEYQLSSAVLMNDSENTINFEIEELDKEPKIDDLKFRLEEKFGGAKQFEKAYKATKPGVLSKIFSRSSTAYHNLDAAYRAFSNPEHALHGNMDALDKSAKEYLQHCFPKLNLRDRIPSLAMVNRLSGTKKARALFSLNILASTAEQRKMNGAYEKIINANRQIAMENEANLGNENQNQLIEDNGQENQNNNQGFQQELMNDLVKDEAPYDQEQAERDYHENFKLEGVEEDEPDVEP